LSEVESASRTLRGPKNFSLRFFFMTVFDG
jgi:hypothetical protein